jgi:hypothetical protein
MKNVFVFSLLLLIISCGKKEDDKEVMVQENSAIAPYDTIAIDSFSTGAISANIALQIKISSQQYKDSLKDVLKKIEAEKLLKKEELEKDKATKIIEAEKKKNEELKLKKETPKKEVEFSPTQNTSNP